MTEKITKQKPHERKPVHFIIPLDSTLEQCEKLAQAIREYAREHPDAHDPRTARRSTGASNTCDQATHLSERDDEKPKNE